MTGDDLIVMAPWLVFGASLVVIGYRLLSHRSTRRQSPPPAASSAGPPRGRSSRWPAPSARDQAGERDATR